MNRLVLVLVCVAVVALIVWAAFTRRVPGESTTVDATDEVIVRFIETAVLREARHAVGARCTELLPEPVVVDLRFECRTLRNAVKLTVAEVVGGPDGGVSAELATCIGEALRGLETHVPSLDGLLDAGARDAGKQGKLGLQVPAGREYELNVTLEVSRLEAPGYTP